MTETFSLYAVARPKNCNKDTAGQFYYYLEAKIVDTNGNRCDVNVDGELRLKRQYNFLGYYNNPEATKEAFDSEGFFRTGDICHFDNDGDLCHVDRKNDLIIYGNHLVIPSRIETVLLESPEIEAVCVTSIRTLGQSMNSERLPAVAVIRKNGSNITAKAIYQMVAGRVVYIHGISY